MNKFLTASLLASAAVASAAIVQKTGSVTTNSTWADIALGKFDTRLGTLDSISIEVLSSNFGGYFTASAPTIDDAVTVNSASATAFLRQKSTNSLGFTQVSSGSVSLSTSPGLPSSEISDASVQFTVNSTSALALTSYSVNSSFWDAFKDATGSGSVFFQSRVTPSVNADTVGSGSVINSTITVANQLRVTYTYTAVPEPSTYGIVLGGLAIAGAVVARRRKQAK